MKISGWYPQRRGSLLIQRTVQKSAPILTRRTVAQRTISTRRMVVEEHGFDTEGGGGEGNFNTVGGSGAICFCASICIFKQLGRLYKSEHNLKTMLRLMLLVHT